MITQEQLNSLRNAKHIQNLMEDHITEALKVIYHIYGGTLSYWFYPGADEGQIGILRMDDTSINIETHGKWPYEGEAFYEDDLYAGSLTCEFPTNFLLLTLDEIKDRVTEFKKQQESEEEKRKEKQKAAKEKKEKLKKQAVKKLTKEERIALGL